MNNRNSELLLAFVLILAVVGYKCLDTRVLRTQCNAGVPLLIQRRSSARDATKKVL
jgi:hypothetical protein